MATTEQQINQMREACELLQSSTRNIKAAIVDDWGRFGNFQLVIYPQVYDRHFTNRLGRKVKEVLPSGAHVRGVIPPGKEQKGTFPKGYVWMVDVDFQTYNPESNTFH